MKVEREVFASVDLRTLATVLIEKNIEAKAKASEFLFETNIPLNKM